MKIRITSYMPLFMSDLIRKIPGYPKIRYKGNYSSWKKALVAASEGYEAAEILNRVKASVDKVQKGEAIFERDAVCFYQEEYRWPVLACLLLIAAQHNGNLQVLDYGGSLGSFYFQHKKFLQRLRKHLWFIVEQGHYVAYGKAKIQDENLYFYTNIHECLRHADTHVVLFSSVLQYLEHPYKILQEIAQAGIQYILIDRTPFITQRQDKLKIQHIPKSIYKASYPVWFLSLDNFNNRMKDIGYKLENEFSGNDQFTEALCKGFLFKQIIG